jgi:hypothetical protein
MKKSYEALWEPVFSPDGESILIKAIERTHDNKEIYFREVVPVNQILS